MDVFSKKIREVIVQSLFALELETSTSEMIVPLLMRQLKMPRRVIREAFEQAVQIWEQRGTFDAKITETCENYAFDRIMPVEKGVLRLALYELLERKQPSGSEIVMEAVRLAKKFSTPEAGRLVNALLDPYCKNQDEVSISV